MQGSGNIVGVRTHDGGAASILSIGDGIPRIANAKVRLQNRTPSEHAPSDRTQVVEVRCESLIAFSYAPL